MVCFCSANVKKLIRLDIKQASIQGTLIEAEAPKSQCRLKRQKLAYDDLILKSPKDNYGVNPV
jgi:hypothetical protein